MIINQRTRSERPRILVVGAGPSGLAFALGCAQQGLHVRVIDKRPSRGSIQKATGVAQGVWHQLTAFGVTQRVRAEALPMSRFVFHDEGRIVADLSVPLVDGQPPALNLAIWDGITLAKALLRDRTDVEATLRRRARLVLRFTHFDYLMLSAKSPTIRFLRNTYWRLAARYPAIATWFFRTISGTW